MATKTKRCLCSSFDFGTYGPDGSAESYEDYNTGCTQTTTRIFAQGHDAKLVGFMVRAELAGEEISTTDGGIRITHDGAVGAASKVSEALALKAQAQLDAARARIAKKVAREAAKAARRSAKAVQVEAPAPVVEQPKTREARIKVGRWTYDAVIDAAGTATYSKKLGGTVELPSGEYTEV